MSYNAMLTSSGSSDTSIFSNDLIHISMNNYDFYMSKPTILDRTFGSSLPLNKFDLVPTIRVYGNLPSGHQVLCHIHGVFPYIFVKYDGDDSDSSLIMNEKCAKLHTLLETQTRISITKRGTNQSSKPPNNNNIVFGNLEHIANVSIVKGIPFYGYHVGWSMFYKITFLNPSQVNKISDLIRNGKVFETYTQTFETHIPYLLQFSADYNLFGCEWIKLNKCYFRKPVLNTILDIDNLMMTPELESFLNNFCPKEQNVLQNKDFPRVGNGLLEIDILPQFIRNIDDIKFRDVNMNFPQANDDILHTTVKYYVASTKRLVNDINAQRSLLSLKKYEKSKDVDRNENIKEDWQSTADSVSFFKKAKDNMKLCGNTPNFKTFVQNDKRLEKIRNIYNSISELWPSIPKSLASQKEEEEDVNIKPIDTSFNDYSTLNLSDNEEILDLANSKVDTLGRENIRGQEEGDDEDYAEIDAIDHLSSELDNIEGDQSTSSLIYGIKSQRDPKLALDFQLTQNMVKRRNPTNELLHDLRDKPTTTKWNKSSLNMGIRRGKQCFVYKKPPLRYDNIEADFETKGYPRLDYQDPFFSNPRDLDDKSYMYAGKIFEINSTHLINRIPVTFSEKPLLLESTFTENMFDSWKYNKKPPTYDQVSNSKYHGHERRKFQSQISSITGSNTFRYKYKSVSPLKKKKKELQDTLTHFSLEIHVNTRKDKRPDPVIDEVAMLFWKIDEETYPFVFDAEMEGVMVVNKHIDDIEFARKVQDAADKTPVMLYDSEFDMFDALTDLILLFDPDILSGFEVNLSSWGYILERSFKIHKFNLSDEISRVSMKWNNNKIDKKSREYTHSSGISIHGRYVLNIWRILRASLALTHYTVENLAYQVLHKRISHLSFDFLTNLWNNDRQTNLRTLINYWLTRVRLNIELLKKQEFIDKTMEQARLIGIDFHSVYYRGSQYKVESFLIRMCKSESYLLLSPNKHAVQNQRALECVPLVMEPESAFYKSPMVVLDFQSLYPSVMIAYNYCYSTVLGRVRELNYKKNIVGVNSYPLKKGLLTVLEDHVTIAPNGLAFVKSSVRKSTLARMLDEILSIRVMVKKTISQLGPDDEALKKKLNNRQLALKLLANVTYGYVSASFSGRMPCSDIADSVVQTGRETLEKAITLIESNNEWGAKIVYGDTDSLFVYLPGKTKDDAFRIGNEISLAVSKENPAPIFLKFEKVFFPSILASKKRYVGYSFEKPCQIEPIFDSKGIETVRRDGHPAQQRIVETALRTLFDTKDFSKVKEYVQDQFTKIYQGNVSIQDFCFAKEVKLGRYKSDSTAPAGAHVAKRQMEKDRRAEPQYKERVPYLVVRSKSGETLRDRSISPEEFFANEYLELDSDYYITKTLIPPLARLFNITGIKVSDWLFDLTRVKKGLTSGTSSNIKKLGNTLVCSNCNIEHVSNEKTELCEKCLSKPRETAISLLTDTIYRQNVMKNIKLICRTCSYQYSRDPGVAGDHIAIHCDSYDCPIYFSRIKTQKYLEGEDERRKFKSLKYLDKW